MTQLVIILALAAAPTGMSLDQAPNPFGGVVSRLSQIISNQDASERDLIDALEALAALGPRSAPAADAIIERLSRTYDNDNFIDEHDLTGVPTVSIDTLATMGEAVVPKLVAALTEGNALVSLAVVRALAAIGPRADSAVPALVDVFVNRRDDNKLAFDISAEAGAALGCFGRAAIPQLTVLAGHDALYVRIGVMTALGKYSDDPGLAVPLLLRGLRDGNPLVRRQAIVSIAAVSPSLAVVQAGLSEVASKDPDVHVRELAAATLKRLPD